MTPHVHKLIGCVNCTKEEAIVQLMAGDLNHIVVEHRVMGTAHGADVIVVFYACMGSRRFGFDPHFNNDPATCLRCITEAPQYMDHYVDWNVTLT